MKIKHVGRKVYEVVALAIAGACLGVYGYILGFINGKNDSEEEVPMEVGEEALKKRICDILDEAVPESAEEVEQ